MLSDSEKSLIRDSLAALKAGLPGFRTRRAQLEMIAAVSNTFAACSVSDDPRATPGPVLCVEAGTGCGKSIAYLVPAIVLGRSRGKRVVVSTSTTALQAQLADKDIPALQRLIPAPFTVAIAKGRARYACAAKLFDLAASARQGRIDLYAGASPESSPVAEGASVMPVYVALSRALESGVWDGDRDSLALTVGDAEWASLTTDRLGCSGNRCPYFAQCPFYRARESVRSADVIIANHSLVLAGLEMDTAGVLPAPGDTLYVFDEAHSLATKAVEHFAQAIHVLGSLEWIGDIPDLVRDVSSALLLPDRFRGAVIEPCRVLMEALGDLHQRVMSLQAFDGYKARRFRQGIVPTWLQRLGDRILAAAVVLLEILRSLREVMLERARTEAVFVQRLLSMVGFMLTRVEALIGTWRLLLQVNDAQSGPVARWIELTERTSGESDFLLCASPLSAASTLRRLLWTRAAAVVMTSATLTSCGSFDLFLRQTGLKPLPAVRCLRVASPFDYARKARLLVPAMQADPRDLARHTQEVVQQLPGLIQTRGTLVLFASGRQMRTVYAALPQALQCLILMQGSGSKTDIITRHKAAIDRGGASVIFGLASFAEGVDLVREYCTHVIVVKLSFPVPDAPIEEARREWIERQGRSAFAEVTVPEAAMRLAQAVGRLLRTIDDEGVVTCLDRRLVDTDWGRRILKGLPPFHLEIASRRQSSAGHPSNT